MSFLVATPGGDGHREFLKIGNPSIGLQTFGEYSKRLGMSMDVRRMFRIAWRMSKCL